MSSFLEALATGLSVTGALTSSGLARSTAYALRENKDGFREAWDEAIEHGTDVLEDEARRRAKDGIEEPVFQGGMQVGTKLKYSDTLMMFLLNGRRPEKYKQTQRVEMTGKDGGDLEITHIQGAKDELVGKLAAVVQLRAAKSA